MQDHYQDHFEDEYELRISYRIGNCSVSGNIHSESGNRCLRHGDEFSCLLFNIALEGVI